MKHLCILLCLSFLIESCQYENPEKGQNVASDMIKKVLYDQQNAWNTGNIELFMAGYWKSDSLSFIGSSGITYGWDQTLANYKKNYPDRKTMGKLTFEIMHLESLSPSCQKMIGRYTLLREEDEPTGLFTLIWKKIEGEWLIVSDQTC